jgi:hypothetical protein
MAKLAFSPEWRSRRRKQRRLKHDVQRAGRTLKGAMAGESYHQRQLGRNVVSKIAYETAADRDGPQTSGEKGVDQAATQVSGNTDHSGRSKTRITRGPGNQGSKGVPEWLRGLKHLRSPGIWNGGDKSGAQPADNQFETPGAGGRP